MNSCCCVLAAPPAAGKVVALIVAESLVDEVASFRVHFSKEEQIVAKRRRLVGVVVRPSKELVVQVITRTKAVKSNPLC